MGRIESENDEKDHFMQFGAFIPACVWLIVSMIAFQAQSQVRPLRSGDIENMRGGQNGGCYVAGTTPCPGNTSGTCDSAKCTVQPNNSIACPYTNQAIIQPTYPSCGNGASGSLTCTMSPFQCETDTPCSGTCSGKQGDSALYCATGGNPTYPSQVNQTVPNNDTCPKPVPIGPDPIPIT